MNLSQPRVANNRLIRRLRKHTGLTTLFRMTERKYTDTSPGGETFRLGELTSYRIDEPINPDVAAPLPRASVPASLLPSGGQVSQQVPLRVAQASVQGPQMHGDSPAKGATAMTLPASLSVEPAVEPDALAAVSEVEAGSSIQRFADDDTTWRRLQKIRTLHQEKERAEAAVSGEIPVAPFEPVQTSPSPDVTSPVPQKLAAAKQTYAQSSEVDNQQQALEIANTAPIEPALPSVASSPPGKPGSTIQDSTPSDSTWPRLQKIFNLHQTKEAAESGATSSSSQPDGLPTAPPASSGESRSEMQPKKPEQHSETVMQRTPLTESGATNKPDTVVSGPDVETTAQPTTAGLDPHVELNSPAWPGPPSIPTKPLSTSVTADSSRSLSSDNAKEVDAENEILITSDPAEEPDRQLLPLEAVWAVQRSNEPVPSALKTEPASTSTSTTALPSEPADPKVAQNIQQVLQRVTTQEPTRASVEVVTPRRARPVQTPSSATSVPSEPGEKRSQANSPTLTVSTYPQSQLEPTPVVEADLVPTEIGPLPRDLWDLMGQTFLEPHKPESDQTAADFGPTKVAGGSATSPSVIQTRMEPPQESLLTPGLETNASAVDSRVGPEDLPVQTLTSNQVPREIVTASSGSGESLRNPRASVDIFSPPTDFNREQQQTTKPEPTIEPTINEETSPTVGPPLPMKMFSGGQRPAISGLFTEEPSVPDEPISNVEHIQRQAASAAPDGGEAPSIKDAPVNKANAGQATIDTDELARRVYGKIKHRLAVEWERVRRR